MYTYTHITYIWNLYFYANDDCWAKEYMIFMIYNMFQIVLHKYFINI